MYNIIADSKKIIGSCDAYYALYVAIANKYIKVSINCMHGCASYIYVESSIKTWSAADFEVLITKCSLKSLVVVLGMARDDLRFFW